MSINNHWRNKQLGTSLLTQELICLNFLNQHHDLVWSWQGEHNNFFKQCQQQFSISDKNPTGLVIINALGRLTPCQFVIACNSLLTDSIQATYLAINRYEFLAVNDLNIDYADSLTESIQQIVMHIKKPFKPVNMAYTDVDGRHFVGVHGLDIFVYENN
jgi:hypothetical protein